MEESNNNNHEELFRCIFHIDGINGMINYLSMKDIKALDELFSDGGSLGNVVFQGSDGQIEFQQSEIKEIEVLNYRIRKNTSKTAKYGKK